MAPRDVDLEAEAERVGARLEARGVWVSADLRVRPDAAAELLGVTVGTLANWRSQLHPLPYCKRSGVSYYLADLLHYIRSGGISSAA